MAAKLATATIGLVAIGLGAFVIILELVLLLAATLMGEARIPSSSC